MSARTPRRNFARPFVVTLAAAPACFTQSAPPPQEPPPQTQPQPQPQTQSQQRPPPTVIANPPRPAPPAAPTPSDGTRWTVFKTSSGCEAAYKVECPKGEPGKPMPTCNPPPPRPYECPADVSLDAPITIVAVGTDCIIEREPVHCPPRVMCNPPPPRHVACPK